MSFEFTGKTIESELLGEPDVEKYKKKYPEYIPWKKSMDAVRNLQRNDPSFPYTDFADDLHVTIAAERLEQEDYSKLKYYTAIDTGLDYYHGVDAFFDFETDDGETITVTIDLTTNPEKGDYKADVTLLVPEGGVDRKDPDGNEEYMDTLNRAADQISQEIKRKARGLTRLK